MRTIEISHIDIILIAVISGSFTLAFCVVRNLLNIPLEEYMIELFLFEFSQILSILIYIVIIKLNKPPPIQKARN